MASRIISEKIRDLSDKQPDKRRIASQDVEQWVRDTCGDDDDIQLSYNATANEKTEETALDPTSIGDLFVQLVWMRITKYHDIQDEKCISTGNKYAQLGGLLALEGAVTVLRREGTRPHLRIIFSSLMRINGDLELRLGM